MAVSPLPKRALGYVLGLFGAALLAGLMLAPLLFNILTALGRQVESLTMLRNLEFERVASRTVLLCAILGLLPALRIGGVKRAAQVGWTREAWRRPMFRWMLVGVLLILAVSLVGLPAGVYRFAVDGWGETFGKLLLYLVGALLVAAIEETVFRGILFGVMRRAVGFWAAAMAASFMYAAVHFAKPDPAVAVVYGHWYEGFRMLPYAFFFPGGLEQVFPFALTLFVLGLVLCGLVERQGNLYAALGLHAGLVFSMRTGVYFLDRVRGVESFWFGRSAYLSKSYAALAVVLLLLVVVLRLRSRIRSPSDTPPAEGQG